MQCNNRSAADITAAKAFAIDTGEHIGLADWRLGSVPVTSNKKSLRIVIATAWATLVVVFVDAVVVFSFWCWSRKRPLANDSNQSLENDRDI